MKTVMEEALDRMNETLDDLEQVLKARFIVKASVDMGEGWTLAYQKKSGEYGLYVLQNGENIMEITRTNWENRVRAAGFLKPLIEKLKEESDTKIAGIRRATEVMKNLLDDEVLKAGF